RETDGKPKFTAETPSRAMRRRPSSFCSSLGFCAEGLCRPSRRVSSSSSTRRLRQATLSLSFQSCTSKSSVTGKRAYLGYTALGSFFHAFRIHSAHDFDAPV